jgi:hypothetical protein
MPTTPNAGLPYPAPGDAPDGAAQLEALAERLDALPGVRAVALRMTGTADAGGNVSVPHNLGVSPDVHFLDVMAPASGNLVVAFAKVRAVTALGLTVRVFGPTGAAYAGSVTLFGLLTVAGATVQTLPAPPVDDDGNEEEATR